MKRLSSIGILLFLLLSLCVQSHAQRRYNNYRSLSVGIKGGATFSKVNFRPSVRESFLPGMTAGVSVRYIEEKFFGIIGEVNFCQFGWKENFSKQVPNTYEYSHTMNYITAAMLSHIFSEMNPFGDSSIWDRKSVYTSPINILLISIFTSYRIFPKAGKRDNITNLFKQNSITV